MSEDRMPPCLKPPNPALGRVRTHNFIKQEMQEGATIKASKISKIIRDYFVN
jgi:hypothetical protein